MHSRYIFVLLIASIFLTSAFAVEKKELWDYWKQSNDFSKETIDHSYWDALLKKYVSIQGGHSVVKYGRITAEDKNNILAYMDYLAGIPITIFSKKEQLAYWINLYNVKVWHVILRYYPVKSINKIDISPGTFSNGPWKKKVFLIERQPVSLYDIKNKILRPIWGDDRILYALNDGAMGSVYIQKDAFTAQNTEALLDSTREEYFQSSAAFSVSKRGTIKISSMFKWYLFDFASDEKALVDYLQRYGTDKQKTILKDFDVEKNKIKYSFDWKLNDAIRQR